MDFFKSFALLSTAALCLTTPLTKEAVDAPTQGLVPETAGNTISPPPAPLPGLPEVDTPAPPLPPSPAAPVKPKVPAAPAKIKPASPRATGQTPRLSAGASSGDHPSYIVKKTVIPPAMDGTMKSEAWASIEWSEPFIDIRGSEFEKPPLETRMKAMWDEKYLYLGAVLQETNIWTNVSTLHNGNVYQANAMEFFLDPDGDGFNYFEFEINAKNVTWTLTMDRPWQDGGSGQTMDVDGLKTAVHVDGTVNNPLDVDKSWSCEVAIPWNFLKVLVHPSVTPKLPPINTPGFRANGARLNWGVDITEDGQILKNPDTIDSTLAHNWVWSPTGPESLIHMPNQWGNFIFTD